MQGSGNAPPDDSSLYFGGQWLNLSGPSCILKLIVSSIASKVRNLKRIPCLERQSKASWCYGVGLTSHLSIGHGEDLGVALSGQPSLCTANTTLEVLNFLEIERLIQGSPYLHAQEGISQNAASCL